METVTRGYTYKTTGNGLTVEIFAQDGTSVYFAQGDEAATVIDSIDEICDYPNAFSDIQEAIDYYVAAQEERIYYAARLKK